MKVLITSFLYLLLAISFTCCRAKKVIQSQPAPAPVIESFTNTVTINKSIAVKEGGATVVIQCSATGFNEYEAITRAESQAFETLLFNGYSSSVKISPLIENRSNLTTDNNNFINNFFSNQLYKSFIISSANHRTNYIGNQLYLVREIQINLNALRKNLEENNLIRKFGF